MLKKYAIAGLILLLAGTAAIKWSQAQIEKEQQQTVFYKSKYLSGLDDYLKQYDEWLQTAPEKRSPLPWGLDKEGKTKIDAQLRREQQERLIADRDKLAVEETDVYPFADILYGENWREELRKYKLQEQTRELTLTASIVCTSIGAAFLGWCILLWTARLIIKGFSFLLKFFAGIFRKLRKIKVKQQIKADTEKDEIEKDKNNQEQEQKPHTHQSLLQKRSQILTDSGWQDFNENCSNQNESAGLQTAVSAKSKPQSNNADLKRKDSGFKKTAQSGFSKARFEAQLSEGDEKTAVMLCDKKTIESEPTSKTSVEKCDTDAAQSDDSAQKSDPNALPDSRQDPLKIGDSFKAQAESLEKQIEEFKQMAQAVQQTTIEHSGPLKNNLEELTQQVSAIREYALHQQDRVKKLQDGYDWNIIRNFCLRVIRCLDNIENRISQLAEQDIDTKQLEEVRDELVFALESSGLEQFKPEINSDYQGQEKTAETISEKESCDNPDLTGKIAKVIRPGYQYFIDEENVKIVRAAQVKLFGQVCQIEQEA